MTEDEQPKIGFILKLNKQRCPFAFFQVKQTIEKVAVGELLEVITSSQEVLKRIINWCNHSSHKLFLVTEKDGMNDILIKRGY
ncbi:MAG: hypothetical protein GF308_16295 [Candidatus Heimdallarchaeota archaeon]|nr:hypothetical protein [Candidatus Heimdallarchaeota archaeon]